MFGSDFKAYFQPTFFNSNTLKTIWKPLKKSQRGERPLRPKLRINSIGRKFRRNYLHVLVVLKVER